MSNNESPLGYTTYDRFTNLLLQNPSKSLKAKGHLNSFEKQLELWEEGKIFKLLHEITTIQERLPSTSTPMSIEKIFSKFIQLMQERKVDSTLRLLINKIRNGILPLN